MESGSLLQTRGNLQGPVHKVAGYGIGAGINRILTENAATNNFRTAAGAVCRNL
jgi:hypothetical protein